uniref:Leucine-rich repeat-containing N-terminal plant-type domain-containing protein n=1 Tax=Brassica oleracea var. oleracea TaxID=109376 RepID=A0A0D3D792_BRAOL
MEVTPYLLFLLFTVYLLAVTTADDRAAMLALAKSFTPPPSDWSTTSSTGCCTWSGVRCTSESDRVTSISLEDESLAGDLAPEVSTLSELKSINLQGNKLSGTIPSLAKLNSLREIYLDSNLFQGVEPGAFAGLTSLRILSMRDNRNIFSWSFPSGIADSTSFTTVNILGLSYNNITGVLPPSLAKSSIQNLRVNDQFSGLSGTIQVLSGMTSLSQAWLQKNQFTGSIPKVLTSLPNLQLIDLSNNNLTCDIPMFSATVAFIYKPDNLLLVDSSGPGIASDSNDDILISLGWDFYC